jgi:hippurate hydrolase
MRRLTPGLIGTLVGLRRDIHQHPELAFKEIGTAQRLIDALHSLGLDDVTRIGATGLVVRVPGRDRSAPVVALRGDIDALPIQEATGLPFASAVPGAMHACGHDVHATWAVGAAALLVSEPADGDVLVILQPAEEIGEGARAILDSGALDDVVAIFGAHVDRRFEVGQAVTDEGPLAASADTFEIDITGTGAHAARPHESRDPIVAGAAIVTALQSIVARRLNPAMPGVVTIGSFHAGSASNIIPDHAHLSGTVRAVDPASRDLMTTEVARIAETVAAAYGTTAHIKLDRGTPPIVNPPEATRWAREAAVRVLGESAVVPLGFLNLAGEDFAHYMERIPGCFIRVGARERGGAVIPAHAPTFYPAEESIFVGAAILAECARVASRANAASR